MLSRIIHEKGDRISVKTGKNASLQVFGRIVETTENNFIDPIASTPPNDFVKKIQMRMSVWFDDEIGLSVNPDRPVKT